MTDTAITVRKEYGPSTIEFTDFSNSAITASTNKREWIVTTPLRIVDVICDSGAAGSGADSDIIDVNKNGTTIYTTQGNRPTLTSGDTGLFTEAAEPEIDTLNPGDVLGYDVDQVCAGGGSTRFKITILCVKR